MAIGFRIRDARTGRVVVDLTDRLSRSTIRGTTTPGVAGSVQIPDYTDGIPYFVVPFVVVDYYPSTAGPEFVLNQTTGVLSWTAAALAVTYEAGVY